MYKASPPFAAHTDRLEALIDLEVSNAAAAQTRYTPRCGVTLLLCVRYPIFRRTDVGFFFLDESCAARLDITLTR